MAPLDGHAPLAPSASSVWLRCPHSAALLASGTVRPPPAGLRARLGRQLHAYAEAAVLAACTGGSAWRAWLSRAREELAEFFAAAAPRASGARRDAWVAAAIAAVEVWVRAVFEFAGRADPRTRVLAPEFPVSVVDQWCYGTADLVIADPGLQWLCVIDFKTGAAPVEARGNPQLLLYAAGAARALPSLAAASPHQNWRLTLAIVQPSRVVDARAAISRPARYTTSAETVLAEAQRVATQAASVAAAVAAGRTAPQPGPHCRYCRARAACPAGAAVVRGTDPLAAFDEPIGTHCA